MQRTRAEVLKEIELEKAELPTDRLDIRINSAEVELARVPLDAPEAHFVYVKATDRTRFVMSVIARMIHPEEDDFIQRAYLIFERGFTEDFALGVAIEIEEFIRADKDEHEPITHSLNVHINGTPELIESLKTHIIL